MKLRLPTKRLLIVAKVTGWTDRRHLIAPVTAHGILNLKPAIL